MVAFAVSEPRLLLFIARKPSGQQTKQNSARLRFSVALCNTVPSVTSVHHAVAGFTFSGFTLWALIACCTTELSIFPSRASAASVATMT